MEQELKYQIQNNSSVRGYLNKAFWQEHSFRLGEISELEMYARYYDTPMRSLSLLRASLRIRREGSKNILTLKYEAPEADANYVSDALFIREEWEWSLADKDISDQEEEACKIIRKHINEFPQALASVLENASWSLLYEARFRRQKADLISDQAVIELAIDTGELIGLLGIDDFCEMELELKEGKLSSLLNINEILLRDEDIAVQPLSKAARLNRLSTADLIVIGAGASGLMAAVTYCRENPNGNLLLLEGQSKAAKKLTATGNGRGNISNIDLTSANYHQTSADAAGVLIEKQLLSCSPEDLCQIFYGLGLLTRIENDRIYPFSYQAKTVSDLLFEAVSVNENARLLYETRVTQIEKLVGDGGETLYRVVAEDARFFFGKKVLLTCGGQAAPKLGSDGKGYEILKQLGHTISPLYPGLVQLIGKGLPKRMNGQRVQAKISVIADGQLLATDFGEILLTDYGLSGIPVLNLSHLAAGALEEGKEVYAELDLAAELVHGELEAFIDRRINSYPDMPAAQFALGYLAEKISSAVVSMAAISGELPLRELDRDSISKLIDLCRHLKVKITGTKGYDFAQVTCGGAICSEFDPETLESVLHPGLYASGEILDVYGDCGGYNLHFAFVSGINAGRAAAASQS